MKSNPASKSAAGAAEHDEQPRAQKSHRKPVRQRGKAKFNALLDATEALLLEQSTDEIGQRFAKFSTVPLTRTSCITGRISRLSSWTGASSSSTAILPRRNCTWGP